MAGLMTSRETVAFLAVVVALAGSARADQISLKCTPTFTSGATSKDPIVEIDVSISSENWHVVHLTQSGAQYWRERQYILRGDSIGGVHSWSGTLISHPNLSMSGYLMPSNGQFDYTETIRDARRDNEIAGTTKSSCITNQAVASLQSTGPPTKPSETDPALLPPISVPMEQQGGTFTVPVQINGAITLRFLVDSGASDVAIPVDVASTLLRTGTITDEDFIGNQRYTLANGQTIPSMTFRIRSLRIAERVITDVKGSVSPAAGSLLLGQSFLRRFRSWTMDNVKQQLILD